MWFEEKPHLPYGGTISGPPSTAGELFESNFRSRQDIENWNSTERQLEDLYDERNAAIEKAIGKKLDNPMRISRPASFGSTVEGFDDEPSRWDPEGDWQRSVRELAAANPDKIADLQPDFAPREEIRRRRRETDERMMDVLTNRDRLQWNAIPFVSPLAAEVANLAYDPIGSAAIMAGQIAGMYNSPADLIPNLFIGLAGGPTQSILKNALKAAVSNTALQAFYEPGVQARRADAGLEAGWDQAFQNLAGAFVMGGVIDPAIRAPIRYGRIAAGSQETFGGVFRDAPTPATKPPVDPATLQAALNGDQAALDKVLDATGLREDPTVRGALQQVEQEAGLRAAGVDDADALETLAQAIRGATDPNEPLAGPVDPLVDARAQMRAAEIETELATLRQGGVDNADRIATLEQERARLRADLEAKTRQAEIADESQITSKRLVADGKPVEQTTLAAQDIAVDRRMFPSRSNPAELANRPAWDPIAAGRIIVWERTDGSKVVVEGRNRVELAQRLAGDNKIEAFVYREADGWNAGDMQVQAALKNMRDGRVDDPVDAALILRSRPELVGQDLAASGPTNKLIRSLTRLSDEAFARVVSGESTAKFGAMVADFVPRTEMHDRILADLSAMNPRTLRAARLAIAELLRVPRDANTHAMLLGEVGYEPGVVEARVAVLDAAWRDLQQDKRTFETVVNEAKRLAAAGNQLVPGVNIARVSANELAMAMLNHMIAQGGEVAGLLDEAARAVAFNQVPPKFAGAAFAQRLRQYMQGDPLAKVFKPADKPTRIDEPWGKDAIRQIEEAEAQLQLALEKARTKEIEDQNEGLFALARQEDNPLAREAQAVTQSIRALEDAMKREGRNATEIAAQIKEVYGLDVDPERIESGDVWWRLREVMARDNIDAADLFGATETELLGNLGENIYVDLDMLPAPELPEGLSPDDLVSGINTRPDAPQIMAQVAANPSEAPRILGQALTDELIERATRMYLEQDMGPAEIAATLMRETRKYVRLDQLTKLLSEADARVRGTNARRVWTEAMTDLIQGVADRMTSGVKLAEQLGLQAQQIYNRRSDLKKAGRKVPDLPGSWKVEDRMWWGENPEAVAELRSPDVRRMTAPDAAEYIGKKYGKKLTPIAIRSARSRYEASSQSAAPARMVTINQGNGKTIYRVVVGSKVEYTTTNVAKAKARLNELIVKSIDDDTDGLFSLPRDTDDVDRVGLEDPRTGTGEAAAGRSDPAGTLSPGRPGATDGRVSRFAVGRGGDYAAVAPRSAGPDGTRSWDIKVFSPTAKAVPSEGASATVTRNAWRSVGNQVAKIELEERAAGPLDSSGGPILLTIRNVEVRENRRGQGVGTAIYDAIEQHFGVRLVPSGFLKDGGFRFWSKRNPEAVRHYQYVKSQGAYLSPNQLLGHYKWTKQVLRFAADDIERNFGAKQLRELKDAIDKVDWSEVTDERLAGEMALPRTGEAPSGIEIGKYGFTPEAQTRIAEIRARVQAVFDRLPPEVKGNLIDSLTYGGKDVDGWFDATEAMVWVSLRAQDPERVAMHEEIHVLRRLKLLTDAEYEALVQHTIDAGLRKTYDIDKRYKKIYERKFGKGARLEQTLIEETVAEMAADYRTGTRFSPMVDRVLAKIVDVLDKVFRAVSGLGFRQVTDMFRPVLSADQVMQRIRSGEVGRRPVEVDPRRADGTGKILAEDRKAGQEMRRTLDNLGFYSKLDEVLGSFGPKDKVTTDTLAKRGVKAAELEARGLQAMLADGKAVPVSDLMKVAGENRVQLNEVMRDKGAVEYEVYGDDPQSGRYFGRDRAAAERYAAETGYSVHELEPDLKADQTKWSAKSLDPTNPTYRETVIHLPETRVAAIDARLEAINKEIDSFVGGLGYTSERGVPQEHMPRFRELRAEAKALSDERAELKRGNFQSGHFDEPNIVGHMMTSLTRHQGKTVFTVDQIQSDWGQKLRDGGVRDEAKIAELQKRLDDQTTKADSYILGEPAEFVRSIVPTAAKIETVPQVTRLLEDIARGKTTADEVAREKASEFRLEIYKLVSPLQMMDAELRTAKAATPGNPFVNTTDQWVNTTLRRAITQAVEADADYIAIPSGDTVLGYNPGDFVGMREFYGGVAHPEKAQAFKQQVEQAKADGAATDPRQAKALKDLERQAKAHGDLTGIVPKNLSKILGTKGELIQTLDSPSGKTGLGKGFSLFPLTSETKSKVKDEGMPMFALPDPRLQPDGEHLDRISTRFPILKSSTEDPLASKLQIDTNAMRTNPEAFEHNMGLIKQYPNWPKSQKMRNADKVAEAFVNNVADNLVWLYNQVPEEIRQRSKLWYEGARNITDRWSEKYNVQPRSVAGVLAALSPQKDWYQNVSLAERVLDIWTGRQNEPWSPEMTITADRIFPRSNPKYVVYRDIVDGKTLGQVVGDDFASAVWVRVYDQTYHDPKYRIVSPEGDFVGSPQGTVAWGSAVEIGKAISALRDPTYDNISSSMGLRHKVRSFFNNILAPLSRGGDVTIDTHAVAAALLRPLAGSDVEVVHNLGLSLSPEQTAAGVKNWKAAAVAGAQGLYGLYADAYRLAAERVGVLPREMQSITWEAIRGLYPATFKRAANKEAIDAIWSDYRNGKLTLDAARAAILKRAGGITPPTWWREGSAGRVDDAAFDTSYAGELPGARLAGGDPAAMDGGARGGTARGAPVAPAIRDAAARLTEAIEVARAKSAESDIGEVSIDRTADGMVAGVTKGGRRYEVQRDPTGRVRGLKLLANEIDAAERSMRTAADALATEIETRFGTDAARPIREAAAANQLDELAALTAPERLTQLAQKMTSNDMPDDGTLAGGMAEVDRLSMEADLISVCKR